MYEETPENIGEIVMWKIAVGRASIVVCERRNGMIRNPATVMEGQR